MSERSRRGTKSQVKGNDDVSRALESVKIVDSTLGNLDWDPILRALLGTPEDDLSAVRTVLDAALQQVPVDDFCKYLSTNNFRCQGYFDTRGGIMAEMTALHVSVQKGLDELCVLLLEYGALATATDTIGEVPFNKLGVFCRLRGHAKAIALGNKLIQYAPGCANLLTPKFQQTALMEVSDAVGSFECANLEFEEYILKCSDNINRQDSRGFSALFWCLGDCSKETGSVQHQRAKYLEKLLMAGARTDLLDNEG